MSIRDVVNINLQVSVRTPTIKEFQSGFNPGNEFLSHFFSNAAKLLKLIDYKSFSSGLMDWGE